MTTPLSKMVAVLIPSSLTPKRGRGSAGSLSEVKEGVAWSCGADLRQWKCGGEFRGSRSAPAEDQGKREAFLFSVQLCQLVLSPRRSCKIV